MLADLSALDPSWVGSVFFEGNDPFFTLPLASPSPPLSSLSVAASASPSASDHLTCRPVEPLFVFSL